MAIAGQFQKDPITVEIASAQKTIHTVEQLYYEVPRGQKGTALKILLRHYAPRLSIIFCNTKKQVDELSVELSAEGMNVLSLHGDMKQEHRTNVMKQYRSGAYPILIATDVAARGIDVDDVELVCNYDIPQDNEYYIHRIGRTRHRFISMREAVCQNVSGHTRRKYPTAGNDHDHYLSFGQSLPVLGNSPKQEAFVSNGFFLSASLYATI